MGYDLNDCWMTCGERDAKIEEYGLGPFGDPWAEIDRLREILRQVNAICHVPSKGRHAYTHFMADFDQIRALTRGQQE